MVVLDFKGVTVVDAFDGGSPLLEDEVEVAEDGLDGASEGISALVSLGAYEGVGGVAADLAGVTLDEDVLKGVLGAVAVFVGGVLGFAPVLDGRVLLW